MHTPAGNLQRRAARVLVGKHHRGAPYAPLLGALERHIGGRLPAELRTELQGCAWLVRLLPELADEPIPPLPAWTLSPAQEHRLMVEAVVRCLTNVAGPSGTLLVLDDLQWAGADALDLLVTLARTATEIPLRMVGAYRDTELRPEDPLAVALADLAPAGLAARRLLGPLAPDDAAHLVDGLLGAAGAEHERTALRGRVLQRAGGVPFFLVSCVQASQREEREDASEAAVPWDIAQSVRHRVAALPEVAREVLGVAAVVGRVVEGTLLPIVAARPDESVLLGVEAACRARLLEERGATSYQFAHDVIREVIEADLGAARRTLLHRRVAEALEQRPGAYPVERLAYHYARGDAGEKAIHYLEHAGDKAQAQYAHAAAEIAYREVLARLDGLARSVHAAHVRVKLGATLEIAAQYDPPLAVLEAAATTYQAAGDLDGLRRTWAQFGRVHAARGTPEAGLARIQPLLEALAGSGPSPGSAAVCAALAWLFLASGRHGECVTAAERAADLARAVGDDRILADVLVRRGTALTAMGRLEEGRQAGRQRSRWSRPWGTSVPSGGLLITWPASTRRVASLSGAESVMSTRSDLPSRSVRWSGDDGPWPALASCCSCAASGTRRKRNSSKQLT
jgi:hypothetical protein